MDYLLDSGGEQGGSEEYRRWGERDQKGGFLRRWELVKLRTVLQHCIITSPLELFCLTVFNAMIMHSVLVEMKATDFCATMLF